MALVLADRVLETTTTAGSGTITLAGAEPGYQSFSAVGNGNQTYYTITADTDWEVGIGTYTASGTTLSRDTVLSSSNSNAKVTFPAGVKKVFVTYPSQKSVNLDISGNISLSSAVISGVGYPSVASDAATKSYVDNMSAAALHIHDPVVLATPASTGRNDTYNNGTAGVSATLTATANGTLTIDSTVAQAAQRVLIKDCDDQVENGIYVVTTVGDGSNPYVMTRASDADTYGEQGANSLDEGSYFYVSGGTSLKGAAFVCNTPGVITFGSTNITFAEFSQTQVYTAGTGISLTNTVISLVSPVAVATGGTGTTATPTNGQLLIGNGTNYTLSTLTAGSGVSITNSAGSITLSATGTGGTVVEVKATSPLASTGGTSPTISIANSTGTGSVVLDQGATISSATITAALSASITTITGTSANITTVTGTTAGFSSAAITQLSGTSAGITTVSGTTTTFSSGTITQFGATSATIATVSGTNVTYSNGNFTSATVTTVSGTTATYTSATVTNLALTSLTITSLSITNLAASSATITTGNLAFSGTAQRITGDMTNATIPSRLAFQTNTTNGSTVVTAIPNGTSNIAAFSAESDSAATNSSTLQIVVRPTTGDAAVIAGIRGTGTYLPMTFYTGGSERMRLDTSGNLGIGTASPGCKLDVYNSAAAAANNEILRLRYTTSTTAGHSGDLNFANATGTVVGRISSVIEAGGSNSGLAFSTYASGIAQRVLIDGSGNVGIGTASPSGKLQVTAANTRVRFSNTAGTASTLLFGADSGETFLGTETNGPIYFITNSTERMRIDSSGNVGIGGTAAAGNTLAIAKNLTGATGVTAVWVSATVQSDATSNAFGFRTNIGTAAASFTCGDLLHFYANQATKGATSAITNQYGYVAESTLTGATNNYGFFSNIASGTGRWGFYGNGTADNYFAGNVGIGKSPTTKLDVSGTITGINGAFTSANITTLTGTTFGTTATTQLRGASAQITNISATSITVTNTPAFVGNGTLTMNVSGTGLSGSASFTANQSGNATFTVTSNATTTAGAANTIVARDGNGYIFNNYFNSTDNSVASGVTAVVVKQGDNYYRSGTAAAIATFISGQTMNIAGSSTTFTSTSQNSQFNSVGVGTAASGTGGEIRATNNVTAYYSDARLKDFKGKIGDALYKISRLNGYYYTENAKAEEFGFKNKAMQVGVSAQEVQAVLPEVIAPAPFDMDAENKSKSGEDYMTVRYDKLVPLLIEAIKELKAEVEALKAVK